MEKDKHITKVSFRKWKKDIIALFPYILTDIKGYLCSSYMHIGQHSSADYNGIVNQSKPAKEDEYKDLKKELESLGYNLEVIKKVNSNELSKIRKEYLKILQK